MRAATRDVLVVLGACLALGGLAEGWARLQDPPDDLLRHWVSARMNLARWTFLDQKRDRLLLEPGPSGPPAGLDEVVPPEPDRPPFDRIAVPYRVRTNSLGFREREFPPPDPARPRVLVLGDSVTFGKGVEEPDRYTVALQQALPDREVLNLGRSGCTTRCMADLLDLHLGPATALVVAQASMNDLDLSLWREAEASRLAGPGVAALRLVSRSRALMALSHALFGDPQDRQWAQAEAAADAFYGPDARRMLDRCAAAGVPLAVVVMPYATGRTPRHPLVEACRGRPGDCRGVLEVRLDPDAARAAPPPSWLVETAAGMDVPVDALARVFPLAPYFHDVIHPSAEGNRALGRQLSEFLGRRGD